MSRSFYFKLALTNLRNNIQTYRPYLYTGIGTICLFFVFHALSISRALKNIPGGNELAMLLSFGLVIVTIFSTVFLLYANSFLIRRRRKEFGLFNILGMEKRHLARIILWETAVVAAVGLIMGMLSGLILAKLLFLFLLRLVSFETPLSFELTWPSVLFSLAVFSGIFALSLVYNLLQVKLAKPIELLKGEQIGEQEPRTKWPLTIIGLAALGAGYYLALTIKSPLQALNTFFIAVVLVMIGTYSLFTTGTVAALKLLRRNKNFYYRPGAFTAISGLLFRLKQNAVGLANICILSTAVLVTLSTTVSLHIGREEQLRVRYPRQISVTIKGDKQDEIQEMRLQVFSVLQEHGMAPEDLVDYLYLPIIATRNGSSFNVDRQLMRSFSTDFHFLVFLHAADLAKIGGADLKLKPGEAVVFSVPEYPDHTLSILDHDFVVLDKKELAITTPGTLALDGSLEHSYYVVVQSPEILEELRQAQAAVFDAGADNFTHFLGFDIIGGKEKELEAYGALRASLKNRAFRIESRAAERQGFYAIYGGLLFIGIFLGTLFLIGTVLIIYYKQITEGYDDQRRFTIMQQVGMGQPEVRKAIRTQVLMVFFLPLTTAGIHVLFAFPMISKMLAVFDLTNRALLAWCSLGVYLLFASVYTLVYSLTAKAYYNLVGRRS